MESDKLNNPFGDILSQYSSNFSSLKSSSSGFDFGDLLNSIAKDSKPNDDESSSEQNQSYDWKSAYETILNDFNSYKKRTELAKSAEKKNLTKEIIKGFLEIIDYILFTYKAKNTLGTYTKEDEMVLQKMLTFLNQYNVKPMRGLEGKPFDHNFHEAIMVDSSGMFEDGCITMVISQGYMIGDEVLRHAKVCVSKEEQLPSIFSDK